MAEAGKCIITCLCFRLFVIFLRNILTGQETGTAAFLPKTNNKQINMKRRTKT